MKKLFNKKTQQYSMTSNINYVLTYIFTSPSKTVEPQYATTVFNKMLHSKVSRDKILDIITVNFDILCSMNTLIFKYPANFIDL